MIATIKEIQANLITLSFPAGLEREFLSEYFRKSLKHVRLALLLALVFYGIFGLLDAWLLPGIKEKLWFIRFAVFYPFVLGVFLFSFFDAFRRFMQLSIALVVLLAGVGIIIMLLIAPSPVNYSYYAGLILVLMFGYTFFKLRFIWATICGWMLVAAYEVGAVWLSETPFPVLVNNNFFFLGANVLGMFACYSIELFSRREFMHTRLMEVEKEKVKEANLELERRVDERTKQLTALNRQLKSEVSERKRAEEEIRRYSENLEGMVAERTEDLARSEARYRTILDSITDGYYEVDLAGNLTFFNDALCEIQGYSRDDLKGMNHRQYTDRENAEKLYREFNKVYTSGAPTQRIDWELTAKDGCKRRMEASISLIADSAGRPQGFRGIVRDTTERKKLEDELMEKTRLAEEASKSKSEFLANMSHEIRTPLNGIIGMTELAMDTGLDENQRNIFHAINSEANTLFGLINDILDFSKIEAGKMELEKIPFDLRALVEELSNNLAVRAEQKGLEFICFMSPDIPQKVIGDPGRLRQVLVNLTGNALKFTEQGEIYVGGEVSRETKTNVTIHFSVKDTGIGIARDKQTKIFESFTQSDGSTTRKYGGTGLGTTISKQLVELMGGRIGLVSEEGKGSTFWFSLPFRKSMAESDSVPGDFDLKGLRVLVVDDNETNRYIQMEYLKSWGCLPVEVCCAREALELLNDGEGRFDLVLSDIQMPDMDGFELAGEIRKFTNLSDIPIIAFTSAGSNGDSVKCREIGINGYLTKPIRRNEMQKVILSVLGISKSEEVLGRRLVTGGTLADRERKGGRILIAEDYPINQEVAMRHLQKAGYEVDVVGNGRLAVEAFRQNPYDLVFMDIQMPVMEGYQATEEIRRIEKERASEFVGGGETECRIPIIAMTAHALTGDREKCMEAGMDDYLPKPLRRIELLSMAKKWIEKGGRSEAVPYEMHSEQPNQADRSPMDMERALAEFDNDREFLLEVLEGFLENVREQLGTIENALKDGDNEIVWKQSHAIKGGAANLSAFGMSEAARELEKACREGKSNCAAALFERLRCEYESLETFADRIR